MYYSVALAQNIATVVYTIAGLCSALIAIDFILTKDGILRKIMIALFLAWALHYLGAAFMFINRVPTVVLITGGTIFTCIDFVMLLALYAYFKWKQ